MTKTTELMREAVCNAKHVFTKSWNHHKKPGRHRYERRKAREYLTTADWNGGEA